MSNNKLRAKLLIEAAELLSNKFRKSNSEYKINDQKISKNKDKINNSKSTINIKKYDKEFEDKVSIETKKRIISPVTSAEYCWMRNQVKEELLSNQNKSIDNNSLLIEARNLLEIDE